MEPEDQITREDWVKSPDLAKQFRDAMKLPIMRTAMALVKEEWRCMHGGRNPTIVPSMSAMESAAAMGFFREGGNASLDDFLSLGKMGRVRPTPVTDNPNFPGDYRLKTLSAEEKP